MKNEKKSMPRTIFAMMINPSGAMKDAFSGKWYLSVAVSALAFGLFFAQTGLDLYKTGQKPFGFVILSSGAGAVYGLLVIPLISVFLWVVMKATKTDKSLLAAVSAFCLSYSGALIYGILGILFSIVLGWKTSVAFGVTGVLWAIGPMMYAIRELSGGKNALSIPLATVVSGIILISWSFIGNL